MANKKHPSTAIQKFQIKRKATPTSEELFHGILNSDKSSLARAITLVESTRKDDQQLANDIIEKCLTTKTNSIRIGITGVPGVGKSTFIEAFGKMLTARGEKVAVLAVDPSSSQTKGSILGDKTRMQELVKDQNAFIRPSPSGISLGGVTRKTRETIILCEAASFSTILIETVGVGQSETAVHSMVDFFLLLKLPGAGDELQGIKRGIVEMADAVIINKADGETENLARSAAVEFSRALHMYPPKENGWSPKVLSCSSIEQRGLKEIWQLINEYIEANKKTNHFLLKRQQQNKNWLLQTLDEQIKQQFYQNKEIASKLKTLEKEVIENKISPFRAAELLMQIHQK